jgi:Domain of unknown function (DUF4158)
MARRVLLSEAWWQRATTIPDDEREVAKHYTLDRADIDLIMRQNKASSRLGIACVLATLRYPSLPFHLSRPRSAAHQLLCMSGSRRPRLTMVNEQACRAMLPRG